MLPYFFAFIILATAALVVFVWVSDGPKLRQRKEREARAQEKLDKEKALLGEVRPPPAGPAPEIGSIWRHKNGTEYTVLAVTTAPDDAKADEFPVTVVYRGPDNKRWPRTMARWYASMTLTGKVDSRAIEAHRLSEIGGPLTTDSALASQSKEVFAEQV